MNPQPRAAEPIIELARVKKVYHSGRVSFPALSGVDLTITAGEMVAVTGPSGSGKTTIINLIAGIDRPTAGAVTVNGSRLDQMTEDASEAGIYGGAPEDYAAALKKARRRAARPEGAS